MGTEKRARQKANRQARLDELAKQQRNQSIRRKVLTWGGLVALFVVAAIVISMVFGGDDGSEEVDAGAGTTLPAGTASSVDASATTGPSSTAAAGEPLPCPPVDGSATPTQTFPAPPPMCIDPAKTYTLATNDFMANGGDGYTAFVGAPQLIDAIDAQLMASQVIDAVAAAGTIAPAVEGRLVVAQ